MADVIINCTVYHQGNTDRSLEEIRFGDGKGSGRRGMDQNYQDHGVDNYEVALAKFVECASEKIRFNLNAFGGYQGTPLTTPNGPEFIKHCLALQDLQNLSIEEFRYISDKRLPKPKPLKYLPQLTIIPNTQSFNDPILHPRTGTSIPPSFQVSWESFN